VDCSGSQAAQGKGVSSTFVAVADKTSTEVLGFYAISLAELINADLPMQYQKRLPAKVPSGFNPNYPLAFRENCDNP